MKTITSLTIALLFSISLYSQPDGYHQVYQSYKGQEGIVSIRVPGFLMKFAGAVAGLDHQEKMLLRSLRSVSVLSIEDTERYPGVNFVDEMDLSRMRGEFQLMMEVHEADQDVVIAAREKRGKITDLIVVIGGEENTLVHLRGRMKSDILEELAAVSGIEQLQVTAKI